MLETDIREADSLKDKDTDPYVTYQDFRHSDVDWIGKIPEHWAVVALKRIAPFVSRGSAPEYAEDETGTPVINQACVYWDGLRLDRVKYDQSPRPARTRKGYLQDGDVLVNSTGTGTLGRATVFAGTGEHIADAHVTIVRLDRTQCEPRYFAYLLATPIYQGFIYTALVSGSTNQIELSREDLRAAPTILPPLDEQRAIAAFLDRETAKIDALIDKKQRLAARLQDKRYGELTNLVLGLRRNDSEPTEGFWTASMPTEWQTVPNRYLFKEYDERGFEELPILNVSIARGVERRVFSDEKVEQRSDDLTVYKRALKGDIVFNKMRMWQGAVGVAPIDGLVSPDYVVARPVIDLESEYFARLFRTDAYKAEVIRHSYGIVWDRNRLYWDGFASIKSLFPPYGEQKQIVEAARELEVRFSRLAASIDNQISHLREYRTALISAAVTGQIDVRDWV